ncbi:MAG: PaaI family thioesterase [Phenylobacterium sp.]
MDGGDSDGEATLTEVSEGEWAGWMIYRGVDPFEDASGPFYWRREAEATVRCAFRAERKHMNGLGFMHGGAIMTFADYCLFVIAGDAMEDRAAVTATFNGEFVGSVPEGALVECRGEVVKATRSMLFVRGLITTGDEPVMSFSAALKRVGPHPRTSDAPPQGALAQSA